MKDDYLDVFFSIYNGNLFNIPEKNQNIWGFEGSWACMHLCLNSDRVIVDVSKLHFRNVNLTDEGVYQCAVENQYGMIVSATWVQVKGRFDESKYHEWF